MDAASALAVLGTLVAGSTVLGFAWRRRSGRVSAAGRPGSPALHDAEGLYGFGERATFLQFSTEVCAPCHATRRILAGIAAEVPGVSHIEVNLARAPELAARFRVRQAPTTFLLDGNRAVRARIGGAPRVPDLTERLDAIVKESQTHA